MTATALVFRLNSPQGYEAKQESQPLNMKRPARGLKALMLSLSMGALLVAFGCNSVPSHTLSIDAISDGPAKFSGVSYRLVARDPVLTREVLQYNLAATCVNTA